MRIFDIDVSLSLGQLIYGGKWWLIIALFVLSSMLPICTLIMLFMPINFTVEIICCLVGGNLISLCILIFAVYLVVKDFKIKAKVKMWLSDAVVLKAHSIKTGEYKSLFSLNACTIDVEFSFDGLSHVKSSDIKTFGGKIGYLTTFEKYADREIEIVYSPKFDEVLIPKQHVS